MSKRLNYQALAMIALTQGEAECRAALAAPSVAGPDKIAQKAATQLAVMGGPQESVSLLNRLAREFAPEESGNGRGRVALSVGMTRSYKAQAVEGSDAFIRLPVGVLGAFKGDEVSVAVENGRLVVTRA